MRPCPWVIAAVFSVGCGPGGVVGTALRGDLPSLQREIAQARAAGKLDRGTVMELARAVAGREVRSATGDTASRRIEEVKPCARALIRVLRDRAKHADDAGALATFELFELGDLDPRPLVKQYAKSPDGAWRAVAARALVLPEHALGRRVLFVDPDERVRRAALNAALAHPDPDDLEPLLEVARLDPDEIARQVAIKAAGRLGGSRAVLALGDLWARADDGARQAMVDAWGDRAAIAAGGRQRLTDLAEQRRGIWSVKSAATLVRLGGPGSEFGAAVLAHFIGLGTDDEKRLAIRLAPVTDSDVLVALRKATQGKDRAVQVWACGRLAELGSERPQAIRKLFEIAQGKDSVALEARVALAVAGDRGAIEPLRLALNSRHSSERMLAARGLFTLGDTASAAQALGDDDPRVRTEVACSILAPQ